MPLDTEDIRVRLAIVIEHNIIPKEAARVESLIDLHERAKNVLMQFLIEAPTDIAALLLEVDRLTAENEGLYAELDDTKAALEDVELECDNMRNRLNDLDIDY